MKKVFTHLLIPKKSVGFLPRLGGMCLFLFISFLVHAQEQAVSDVVNDEGGQPLQAAAMLEMFASDGITTDAGGKHFTCLVIKENKLNQI